MFHTLLEAILLVVLVVILFLQTWRASIIPLVAVPVSVIGTFAVLLGFGFSINTLSLFGLVLAIGIVVDDAIVVVENVERHIEEGLSPLQATKVAMDEVSRPIIAITLVLCAVFVPVAFVSGLTGEFYRQFALTIAISSVISAFNSLTLSPALAALLLKPQHEQNDWLSRGMRKFLGKPFGLFNRAFIRTGNAYSQSVSTVVRRTGIALAVYGGLIVLTYLGFAAVPGVLHPVAGQAVRRRRYTTAAGFVTRPFGRSVEDDGQDGPRNAGRHGRRAVRGHVHEHAECEPEQRDAVLQAGRVRKREHAGEGIMQIAGALSQKFGSIQEAYIGVFPPPPIQGLGTLGGFKLHIEDRSDQGPEALYKVTQEVIAKAYQNPKLAGVFSSYQINVPQLMVNVDRVKAKQQDVKLSDVFQTMQVYLGSLYVNDFNRFGRTYQVVAQADAPFRAQKEDILKLKTRNAKGEMVPLGSLIQIEETFGPGCGRALQRLPFVGHQRRAGSGFSSGEAEAAMSKILDETLPRGMRYEWTDLSYQQKASADTTTLVFALCVVFVFLVLAAQYESVTLPLAIVLIVPIVLLAGVTGVLLSRGDANIFTQIGLVVLVGLASKNAILIVEFAKHLQDQGKDAVTAVLEAGPAATTPDSDDVDCVHRGCDLAGARDWRRCGDSQGDGRRGVRGDDRRDGVRVVPDAGVLRADASVRT